MASFWDFAKNRVGEVRTGLHAGFYVDTGVPPSVGPFPTREQAVVFLKDWWDSVTPEEQRNLTK